MHHHDRRLPHWDTTRQPLFVTFRLHGSLPHSRDFPPAYLSSGQAFVAMDRLLDRSGYGPVFLQGPEVALLVWERCTTAKSGFAVRIHCSRSESDPRPDWRVLAEREPRSSGPQCAGVRAHPGLHRTEPGKGGIGCIARTISLVQRSAGRKPGGRLKAWPHKGCSIP